MDRHLHKLDILYIFSCISIGVNKKNVLDVKACNQCGVCAKKCPEKAISKNAKGVYAIDKKKCTKCLTCVDVCNN